MAAIEIEYYLPQCHKHNKGVCDQCGFETHADFCEDYECYDSSGECEALYYTRNHKGWVGKKYSIEEQFDLQEADHYATVTLGNACYEYCTRVKLDDKIVFDANWPIE